MRPHSRPATAGSLVWLLVIGALLGGCVAEPRRASAVLSIVDGSWPERRASLQELAQFSLSGRIAVAAAEQGFSGHLRYGLARQRSDLMIDGPMGIGGLHIGWDGEAIEVVTSRGLRLDGAAARAEIERRLGFALPLAELRYWLLGVPTPNAPAQETLREVDGVAKRLAGLQQSDWVIDYASYGTAPALPNKLTARRADTRVRIVVDRWQP